MRPIFLALASAMTLSQATRGAAYITTKRTEVITATLIGSKTTQDFVSLLPLTVTMDDLFRRKKFGRLPRAIPKEGERTHKYEVGDIAIDRRA